MAGAGKKWLIGCGVGCGVTILLNIFLLVGAGILFTRPMDKAVNTQKELAEAMGEPNEYVPEPGSLTPARLEIFLAVRSKLMPSCEEFESAVEGFQAMDALGENDEEPSMGEVFRSLGSVMGSVKGMVMEMGEVLKVRNLALLENGMGMGEYTWIYVMSYNSWLGHMPNEGLDTEGGHFSSRESDLIKDLMENHANALASAGRSEEAQLWRQEIKKLNWYQGEIPFNDGSLPKAIKAALEPYRTRLEEVYCGPMSEFDLGQLEKKGMSFTSD